MRPAIWLVPLLGTVVAIAFPLTRYVEKRRHEQTAIDVLQEVRRGQETFRQQWGGYATDIATLGAACGSVKPALDQAALTRLHDHGYRLSLRAARGAAVLETRDCRGHALTTDFYAAAEPIDAGEAGQQAFAARASGDVQLSYDGLAPNEAHMAAGLSTPLSQRATFRIP